MRRYNLCGFARNQAEKLEGEDLEEGLAFCRGINDQFIVNPTTGALIGYLHEHWGHL